MQIKDTIPFVDNTTALPQSADPHQEQQDISITMPNRQKMHIGNIYIPPSSSCSDGHKSLIAHIHSNNKMSLIVLDINAHHFRWDTNTNEYERGKPLADQFNTAGYTIHNENEAARLPTNSRSPTNNNRLASNYIAQLSHLSVSMSLASDHLPIAITINAEQSAIVGPRRTYVDFKKADWSRYAETCNEYLVEAGKTGTVELVEKTFRKVLNKASTLFNRT